MSVLCCRVPDFLLALTARQRPGLGADAVALLGPDERVLAVSTPARRAGVVPEMTASAARSLCPALHLLPADLQAGQAEQAALLALLGAWDLPVEPLTWGAAYVDLQGVAGHPGRVQPLAADLGRRMRRELGADLAPALGWDSGKFTARAAAACAGAGHMRLVGKQDEIRFLAPLPVTLLPLPLDALQQLHWLGIRTLGQFAALPPTAVWQRFGRAGRMAQRWAQGQDDRPVQSGVIATAPPVAVDLDPPAETWPPVLEALCAELAPWLTAMADRLQGCRHLRLHLTFLDGQRRRADLLFVQPTGDPAAVRRRLQHELTVCTWPASLLHARLDLLESGEIPGGQLALFAELTPRATTPADLARLLQGRYGPCFFRPHLAEPDHPAAERRACFQTLP